MVEIDDDDWPGPFPLWILLSQFQTEKVTMATIIKPATSSIPSQGQKTAGCFFLTGFKSPVVGVTIFSSGRRGASDSCLDILWSSPQVFKLSFSHRSA